MKYKKILTVLFILFTICNTSLSDPYQPEKLSGKLKIIKTVMKKWKHEGPESLKYFDAVISEDLSSYQAYSYLIFYQSLSHFFYSQNKDLSIKEKLLHLKIAYNKFNCQSINGLDTALNILYWKSLNEEMLIQKSFENKQYFEVLKYISNKPDSNLSILHIQYFGESLRQTKQLTRLKRIILAYPKYFILPFQFSLQKKDENSWNKILDPTANAIENSIRQKAKPKSLDMKDNSITDKWKDFFKKSQERYFGNHENEFSIFLKLYLKLLEAKSQKNKLNDNDKDFFKKFEKNAEELQAKLLKKLIFSLWQKNYFEKAIDYTDIFLDNFPGHPDYPMLTYDKSRIYEDWGKYSDALEHLEKMKKYLLGSKYEENFFFRRAWQAYLGSDKKSLEYFNQYLEVFPAGDYKSLATYYKIKLLSKNNSSKAKNIAQNFIKVNPLNYYSLKLLEEWNFPEEFIFSQLPSEPKSIVNFSKKNNIFKTTIKEQAQVLLYEELQRLGLKNEALFVLSKLLFKFEKETNWLAYLLREGETGLAHHITSPTVAKIMQGGANELKDYISWKNLYPQIYKNEISEELAKIPDSNLNYHFVLSLIRQESAFNPYAVSSADAKGLMQLIPGTAKDVARRINMKEFDLFDYKDNLTLGINLLEKLNKKYNGRLDYVLSAYNAGESVTDRWLAARGNLETDEFIDSIPYGETREYIKLIFRNMIFYNHIYDDKK